MSPVWIRKAGFSGMAVTCARACWKVSVTLVLTGLLKPRWLSLTWAKLKPKLGAAVASSIRRARGRPPATVQTTALPAQVMHFRNPRRLSSYSICIVASFHSRPEWPTWTHLPGCSTAYSRGRKKLLPGISVGHVRYDHQYAWGQVQGGKFWRLTTGTGASN